MRTVVAAAGGVLLMAALCLAQETVVDGYEAGALKPAVPWGTIAYAVVSVLAIALVGFKNAKRTHLD